jgi:hypothetical protein
VILYNLAILKTSKAPVLKYSVTILPDFVITSSPCISEILWELATLLIVQDKLV